MRERGWKHWTHRACVGLLVLWWAAGPVALAAQEEPAPEPSPVKPSVEFMPAQDAPEADVTVEVPVSSDVEAFLTFMEENKPAVDSFTHKHHDELWAAAPPYAFRMVARVIFFGALITGICFFPAAYVASLLLAPMRATMLNAAVFSGIQIIYLMVMASILYLLSGMATGVYVGVLILLLFFQLGLLITMTRSIYDITLTRTLLFGVVGSIIQQICAGVLGGIIAILLPHFWLNAMQGPGTDYLYEAVLPMIQQDIDARQPQYERAAGARSQQEQELAKAQEAYDQLEAKQEELGKKIEAKRASPMVSYAQIGQLADRGDMAAAKAAYEDFAKKNPGGPLGQAAQEQAAALDARMKQSADELAQQEAEAKRRAAEAEADMKARLQSGQATLSDVRRVVLGLSREQVRAKLGEPTGTATNAYIYRNIEVYDPLRKVNRTLVVVFLQGTVQGVNYGN